VSLSCLCLIVFGLAAKPNKLLLEAVETTTELLNSTGCVNDGVLSASVKRVRFGADVQLDHWVFLAFMFSHFAAWRCGATNKLKS